MGDAAGTKTRRRISSEINGESGALTKETAAGVDAGQTAPQAPVFEDVLALDDDALRRVIGAADPKDVVLSLAGSERDVIDRVLRNMKPRDASRLRRAFHAIDPLSLTDVNGSQDKIAILAARMDQNGRLRPSSVSTSHA
jgi:flagellar motor switch protein FliG